MPLTADGRYDRNAPGVPLPPIDPWQTNEERLCDVALWTAYFAPAADLRTTPPTPPRFGYDREPLTARQVIGSFNRDVQFRFDFSGQTGGYGGTSTPSLGY